MFLEPIMMFLKAADMNNMKQAAGFFDTTRDRIRNKIIHLEKEVGRELLVKTPFGSYLNSDGEIMYKAFREMMLIYNNALLKVEERHNKEFTTYKFAVTEKLYDSYYHRLINKQSPFENVKLEFSLYNYDEFYETVNKGLVDFVLLYESKELMANKSLAHIPVYKDKLCLMISPYNDLSKRTALDLTEIENQTIYYEPRLLTKKMEILLNKLNKHNTIVSIADLRYDDTNNMIKNSKGCFFWHHKNAAIGNSAGLISVPIYDTEEQYYLVYKAADENKNAFATKIVDLYKL